MASFLLLLGVLVCQAATGYLAFHVSTPANTWKARLTFGAITIVGMVLAIFAHSVDEKEAASNAKVAQKPVLAGIDTIESGMNTGFAQIRRDLGSPKTVSSAEANSPIPQHKKSTQKAAESTLALLKQSSRLSITGVDIAPLDAGNSDSAEGAKITFVNKGAISAWAPVICATSKLLESEPMESDVTALAASVDKCAYNPILFSKERSQADTGQSYWKWAPGVTITQKDLQDVKDRKKIFQIFFSMAYFDDLTPPKKYWLTEFVTYITGDLTQRVDMRLSTTLKDVPKQ
jgi:hypothetical protein